MNIPSITSVYVEVFPREREREKKLHALHITAIFGFGNALNVSSMTFYSIANAFWASEDIKTSHDCRKWNRENNHKEMKTFCCFAWMARHFSNRVNFFNGFFYDIATVIAYFLIFVQYRRFSCVISCWDFFLSWKLLFFIFYHFPLLLYYSLKCCFMSWERKRMF